MKKNSTRTVPLILLSTMGVVCGILAVSLLTITPFHPAAPTGTNVPPIPPFEETKKSSFLGTVTDIGQRNNITISKVTFPVDTDLETLSQNIIYLVETPSRVEAMPLDFVFSTSVDFYGYKYTSAAATTEIANRASAAFTDRFPGTFFASQRARDMDSSHDNALATFESSHTIAFGTTDTGGSAIRLEPNALYVIVMNENTSKTMNIAPSPVCGDGWKVSAEGCDDGGTENGNGCSTGCTVETGYDCTGNPSVCAPVCGDGLVTGSEGCDDGGTVNGNGCSAICETESGYSCSGQPSSCSLDPVCGNDVIEGSEECDEGANNSDSDPDATCRTDCTLQVPVPF